MKHKIGIGYHSDNGNIYKAERIGKIYGATFKNGDIIGCCIDFISSIVFFTKNGHAYVIIHIF